jgi:hypothetical protein
MSYLSGSRAIRASYRERSCDLSSYIFGLDERKCSRLLSLAFNFLNLGGSGHAAALSYGSQ